MSEGMKIDLKNVMETAQAAFKGENKIIGKTSSVSVFGDEASGSIEKDDFTGRLEDLGFKPEAATAFWDILNFDAEEESESKLDDREINFWLNYAGKDTNNDGTNDTVNFSALYNLTGISASSNGEEVNLEDLEKAIQEEFESQNETEETDTSFEESATITEVSEEEARREFQEAAYAINTFGDTVTASGEIIISDEIKLMEELQQGAAEGETIVSATTNVSENAVRTELQEIAYGTSEEENTLPVDEDSVMAQLQAEEAEATGEVIEDSGITAYSETEAAEEISEENLNITEETAAVETETLYQDLESTISEAREATAQEISKNASDFVSKVYGENTKITQAELYSAMGLKNPKKNDDTITVNMLKQIYGEEADSIIENLGITGEKSIKENSELKTGDDIQPQVGDLVRTTYVKDNGQRVTHTGIVVGVNEDGTYQVIEANSKFGKGNFGSAVQTYSIGGSDKDKHIDGYIPISESLQDKAAQVAETEYNEYLESAEAQAKAQAEAEAQAKAQAEAEAKAQAEAEALQSAQENLLSAGFDSGIVESYVNPLTGQTTVKLEDGNIVEILTNENGSTKLYNAATNELISIATTNNDDFYNALSTEADERENIYNNIKESSEIENPVSYNILSDGTIKLESENGRIETFDSNGNKKDFYDANGIQITKDGTDVLAAQKASMQLEELKNAGISVSGLKINEDGSIEFNVSDLNESYKYTPVESYDENATGYILEYQSENEHLTYEYSNKGNIMAVYAGDDTDAKAIKEYDKNGQLIYEQVGEGDVYYEEGMVTAVENLTISDFESINNNSRLIEKEAIASIASVISENARINFENDEITVTDGENEYVFDSEGFIDAESFQNIANITDEVILRIMEQDGAGEYGYRMRADGNIETKDLWEGAVVVYHSDGTVFYARPRDDEGNLIPDETKQVNDATGEKIEEEAQDSTIVVDYSEGIKAIDFKEVVSEEIWNNLGAAMANGISGDGYFYLNDDKTITYEYDGKLYEFDSEGNLINNAQPASATQESTEEIYTAQMTLNAAITYINAGDIEGFLDYIEENKCNDIQISESDFMQFIERAGCNYTIDENGGYHVDIGNGAMIDYYNGIFSVGMG